MNSYQGSMDADGQPRTLYVGNLDLQVSEDLLIALFGQMGHVKAVKIINESGSGDPYAFIEFLDNQSAAAAMQAMNKRHCMGKEMKVNWASSSAGGGGLSGGNHHGSTGGGSGSAGGGYHKADTSKHHHIFVGDLSPQIETTDLREAFAAFGEISDCRVVKDANTQKSKGYGFVSFVNKEDAENAIQMMNGSWLGSRAIRTNWATRKPPSAGGKDDSSQHSYHSNSHHNSHNNGYGSHHGNSKSSAPLDYETVYGQSSPTNCTVYCGGLNSNNGGSPSTVTDEVLRNSFQEYGPIVDIRIFKEKGYAFIKFAQKESACKAIVSRHNTDLNGQTVKCSWGKEQDHHQQSGNANHHSMMMMMGGQCGGQAAYGGVPASMQGNYGGYPSGDPYQMQQYWYGQGYPATGMGSAGDYTNSMGGADSTGGYSSMQAAAAGSPMYGGPYGQFYGGAAPGPAGVSSPYAGSYGAAAAAAVMAAAAGQGSGAPGMTQSQYAAAMQGYQTQ